jgi:hypothetical protein
MMSATTAMVRVFIETLPSFAGRSLAAPNGRMIIPAYPDTTDDRSR